jgi:Tol biopolymer transport system component
VQFSAAAFSTSEDAQNIPVTITRSNGTTGAIGISVTTSDGTAVAAEDYDAVAITVEFADGNADPITVNIPVIDDALDEPNETFSVALSTSAGGATLGAQTTATLTIVDEDVSSFRIGGELSGLSSGASVTLQNSGSDSLTLTDNGAFMFNAPLAAGAAYEVTVAMQPTGPTQLCTVTNGTGVVASSDVVDIEIDCVTSPQPVVYHLNVAGQDDLYLINDDGSGLTTIAATTGHERFIAITPTGRVIFSRMRSGRSDLYSVRLDGTDEVELAVFSDSESPDFVTDTGVLIFSSEWAGSYDLYAINADGTGFVILADGPENEWFAALTSDGRVVYEHENGGQRDLYSVNLDGSDRIALSVTPDHEEYAGVTPDGRILVEVQRASEGDLYIIDADGTNRRALAQSALIESFAIAVDDGIVIFSRDSGGGDVFAVDTETGTVFELAASPNAEEFAGVTANGSIVFTREMGGQSDLYAIDVRARSTEVALANDPAVDELFIAATRGGRVLVNRLLPSADQLISVAESGQNEIVLADEVEQVLADQRTLLADEHIPFSRGTRTAQDLYSIHSDGTGLALLSAAPEGQEFQDLTASGRLIFARLVAGQTDLFSVRPDGTDLRVLADTPENESLRPGP